MEWHVKRATEDDIKNIAPRLRQIDKDEIMASSGSVPEECLLRALNDFPALGTWAVYNNGTPEIIFGCTLSADPNMGIPWMVSTDALAKAPREFIKKCKMWITGFQKQFPVLKNFVSAKNTLHIRWLKWCGFEFVQLHGEFGAGKEPFWEFEMKQKEI